MSEDLLSNLGLEFVNPTAINTGLKQLKPSDEPQIFSIILSIPGLENTTIKYERHNFYNQIRKNIRCSGGTCCVKAQELNDWLSKLPDGDERKRQKPLAQTRYILPVVLYQGKTAQAYGGPIEVRYIDIAKPTYIKWDQARSAVNEEIAPFYQRDFIMTCDPNIKSVPVMTHLESRAKWLTDPTINAEVMAILNNPNFIQDYVKVVPPKMNDSDFISAWNASMHKTTVAEQVLNNEVIKPAIAPNFEINQNVLSAQQPISVPNIQSAPTEQAFKLDMNAANTPQIMVQENSAQSVEAKPAEPAQTVAETVPINVGLPTTSINTTPNTNVPFTPQNIINGTYSAGALTNTITPEAVVTMQPVTLAPAQVVEQATNNIEATSVNTNTAEVPTTSQSEISLANIGDLDAIMKNLPPV